MGKFNKIRKYFTTFQLTRGFFTALLASAFLYLSWLGFSHPLINTIFAVLSLCLLLSGDRKVWMVSGFFIGIFWFWWISMSFRLYGFPWAIPIGIFSVASVYAFLFWLAASLSEQCERHCHIPSVWPKALYLLTASYIHPFGFDWFKPELMLTESYLGIQKWQFALILLSIVLTLRKRRLFYLLLILLAYQPTFRTEMKQGIPQTIELVTTHIPIHDKWDPKQLPMQINTVIKRTDMAIVQKKKLIIFPESVLPIFLNREQELLEELKEKSNAVTIVIGALKWDENVPRNSTYIFQNGKMKIADKVLLVPFGESNPLPDWMGKWINRIFYDGAVDYKASSKITDYTVDGKIYRNAICYEACSERLYEGKPENMIVLSNNGWFIPSIEPVEQRLLLQYYSRKYGTIIYHSVNMSPSYMIKNGKVLDNIGN